MAPARSVVLGAAEAAGLELPVVCALAERMHPAQHDGHGDEDMAATYWASAPDRPGG
jgi:3-hydroxyisobutyrate dehydrogenase